MDELKLSLSTKFMRGIIAKLIAAAIHKKLGYSVDVFLNEVKVTATDGKIHIHVDIDADMTTEEFAKIVKSIGTE